MEDRGVFEATRLLELGTLMYIGTSGYSTDAIIDCICISPANQLAK